MLLYFSVDNSSDNSNADQITHNEKLNNQRFSNLLNSLSQYSQNKSLNNTESNQESNDNQQNNIDFGQSILSSNSSVDDEFNFDRLGPFEKLCSLCDNPTPSNM